MRFPVIACFLLFFSECLYAFPGGEDHTARQERILIVLNGSASMGQGWGNSHTRYDAAADIITTLVSEVYKTNPSAEFGLRVYGHQYNIAAGRCNDSRKEVAFSKDNLAQITLRLKDIRPRGKGSVEYAVTDAARNDITDTDQYRYSIIVLTDSSSACPDNICIPVNMLGKNTGLYKRYVIDLTGKETPHRYTCFDKIFPAVNDYSIDTCIKQIVKDYKVEKNRTIKVVYESKPPARPQGPQVVKIVKPVLKTDTIAVAEEKHAVAETAPAKPVKAVQIRKESKIKSEVDFFGYLKLVNTALVSRIIIYRLQDDSYEQTNEIYPVGMHEVKVKLKTGSYKMLFNVSGLAEGSRTFEIKEDKVNEIWFR